MRRFSLAVLAAIAVMVTWGICAGDTSAQMMPMVEPEPERPGDRALTCEQLAREMGAIMKKRNLNAAAKSSKSKICRGSSVLKQQGEERKRLMVAQTPQLAAAGATAGPAAAAIINKTQAEQMALDARQQPGRRQAVADVNSGIGDMMGVMNDPRLMRLGMLAMAKNCGDRMAPPPEDAPAAVEDGCDIDLAPEPGNQFANPSQPPAERADPFAKPSATPAKSAVADPFARR